MKWALAALAVVGVIAGKTRADLYWDSNGVAVGAGSAPTGVWGADGFWSLDSNGAVTPGAWSDGETAVFAAGSDATGSYTVTVGGEQTAGGIRVEEGAVTLSGGTLSLTGAPSISVAAGRSLTVDAALSGSAATVVTGGGTVQLTNSANAYTGPVAVTGGSLLRITNNSRLSGPTGNLTLDGGTFQNDNPSASSNTLLDSGREIIIGAGGGSISVPGGALQVYAGSISGTGNTLTKSGTGTLRVNTNATFSKLVVTGGLYQAGVEGAFGAAPTGVLEDAITLDGGGVSINAVININGNRRITLGPGGGTFNTPTTFNSSYGGVISGPGSLTKTGNAILTLTNSGNSYAGSTTIVAGTITIDSDARLGNGAGALVLSGGRLHTTASRSVTADPIPNPLHVTANSQITTQSTSPVVDLHFTSDSITGSGGTLTLRNDATSGGGVFDVRFSGSGFDFSRPILFANGAAGSTARISSFNATGTTQTFSGVISGVGGFRRSASDAGAGGDTILSGTNTYSGGTFVTRGFIGFGSSTTGNEGSIESGPVGTGSMTVGNDANVGFFASGGARTVANPLTIEGNTVTIKGAHDLELSGAMSLGGGSRTINVTNSATTAFSGTISNGGVVKAGAGSLTLRGANDYAGGTIINNGAVYANNAAGSATGSGAIAINAGGILAGTGAVAGPVNVNGGGVLAPGASVESLNTGALSFASGATLQIELDSAASLTVGADLVNSSGGLTLTAGASLVFADVAATSSMLPVDTKFTLIRYDATAGWNNVEFVGYADESTFTVGANTFKIDYNDTTGGVNFGGGSAGGGFLTLLVQPAAVPEASAALFGVLACSLAGLVHGVRRWRQAPSYSD